MFHTQAEAKRFLAEKVVQQARAEGIALSDAERGMLFWSESDPEFTADPGLADALAIQLSEEEYELKISGLLARAFDADVAADAHARDRWRQACTVLAEGDHYISLLADRAVGPTMKNWWQFWR